MTDWIHCNKCYLRFHSGAKFYVTSCGHLECNNCILKLGNDKRCLICKSSCDIVVLNNINSELQSFFQPAGEFIEKAKQIYTFQYNNMSGLLKHMVNKYTALKNEAIKIHKGNLELKKENSKFQKENIRLRMLLKQLTRGSMATSTPAVGGPPATPLSSLLGSTIHNAAIAPGTSSAYIATQMNNAEDMPRSFTANAVRQHLKEAGKLMSSTPMMNKHPTQLNDSISTITTNPGENVSFDSYAQMQGARFMQGNISRMMQHRYPPGINSFTSHSGSSLVRSPQEPSPAQASIPRYGTPSFPNAAMRSMSNLGLGNKPR